MLSDEQLAEICKALGHPARIRILRRLIEEDQCVCGQIVEALPLAQSTVSQHLKILKEAGLIRGTISGPSTCYCVNKETLNRLGSTLHNVISQCREETKDHEKTA